MAVGLVLCKENITTGAGLDIQQATRIAKAMVTEYGLSDRLGPLRFSENEEEVFLGRSVTQSKHVSDATALIIDEEVRAFVDIAEGKARKILTDHRDELEIIAQSLLEYETLSGKEVSALLRGEKIQRRVDQSTFSSKDDSDEEDVSMDAGETKHEPKDGKETGQES